MAVEDVMKVEVWTEVIKIIIPEEDIIIRTIMTIMSVIGKKDLLTWFYRYICETTWQNKSYVGDQKKLFIYMSL